MMLAATTTTALAADNFKYADEQFADIQMLRYKVENFDQLSLRQKTLVYYLSEAALQGRDILFDQMGVTICAYGVCLKRCTLTIKVTVKRLSSKP